LCARWRTSPSKTRSAGASPLDPAANRRQSFGQGVTVEGEHSERFGLLAERHQALVLSAPVASAGLERLDPALGFTPRFARVLAPHWIGLALRLDAVGDLPHDIVDAPVVRAA